MTTQTKAQRKGRLRTYMFYSQAQGQGPASNLPGWPTGYGKWHPWATWVFVARARNGAQAWRMFTGVEEGTDGAVILRNEPLPASEMEAVMATVMTKAPGPKPV